MDTYELQYILDHSYSFNNIHSVVCAKDELSKEENVADAYIVNTDNSNQPGKHWILLYFKDNTGFYYNSYGSSIPIQEEIVDFMNINSYKWTRNNNRIQSVNSYMCGVFCIFVLDLLVKNVNLPKIINSVFHTRHENLYKNDVIVKYWFNKYYRNIYNESHLAKLDYENVNKKCIQCCTCE